MHVIGITGPIGHGKSTLANALMNLEHPSVHMEVSILISQVANEWLPLMPKQVLLTDIDYESLNQWIAKLAEIVSRRLRKVSFEQIKIDPEDVKNNPQYTEKLFVYIDYIRQGMIGMGESITEENKDRHRAILQWLGGYLIYKVSKGIWFDEIEKMIHQAKDNGVKLYIVGGVRYKYDEEVIHRNNGVVIELIRADLPEREVNDVTEQERKKLKVDTRIISEATPEALGEVSKAFFQDLLLNDLIPEYNSKDYQPMA